MLLLIEDDPDVAESLEALLTRRGHSVRVVRDGLQALTALQSGELPELMLLDLMMANMDGQRFLAAQREEPRFASVPTIVITSDTRANAEQLGVAACFYKPFDVAKLLAEINRHVKG